MSAVKDFLDLRAAIVARLKDKLTGVDVGPHGGAFDLEEIRRYAALAPAVRVCVLGCGKGSRFGDGRWKIPVHCAAVIVTKDGVSADRAKIVDRDAAALSLAAAVELCVQGARFGLGGVFQPEDLTARNEYSGALDETGIALWQVIWTTPVLLGESMEETIAALVNISVVGTGDPIFETPIFETTS